MNQPIKISVVSQNTCVSMTVIYSNVRDAMKVQEDLQDLVDGINVDKLSKGLIEEKMPNLHLIENPLIDVEVKHDLIRKSPTVDGGYIEPSLTFTLDEYSYCTYHNPEGEPYYIVGPVQAAIRRKDTFCKQGMFVLNKDSAVIANTIPEAVLGSLALGANLTCTDARGGRIKPQSTPQYWPINLPS